MRLACLLAGAAALAPGLAEAGAWNQPKGQGQVIIKYEDVRGDEGFDPDGVVLPLLGERLDRAARLFAEYGLTDTLTLQVKTDWQQGRDAFIDYEGRGLLEIGVSWQAWRDDWNAVSLYAGYADAGEGRNAGYAAPGVGERDWEVRVSAGRSIQSNRRWAPRDGFVEIQAARRIREGLPDEVRVDLTVGARHGDWLLLAQAFGGATDDDGARWLTVETSLVRDFGAWSLQAGWRDTVWGRETAIVRGPVVALWWKY